MLKAIVATIDTINVWMGRLSAVLILVLVSVCAATAILRYTFSIGFVWMQEGYTAAFGVSFMLMAGYAYLTNQHVRVDIFHDRYRPKTRAWVEIGGIVVCLWPWLYLIAMFSADYILRSWALREASSMANGLPGYFILKSVIWVFCGLLFLQSIATLIRAYSVIAGRPDAFPAPTADAAQMSK